MKRIAGKGVLARFFPTPIFPGQILLVNLPGFRLLHSPWEDPNETL